MDRSQGTLQSNTSQGPGPSQYQLLSELPVCRDARMPAESPIDKITLEKKSPSQDPEEKIEKDIKPIVTETTDRMTFALNQSKHQRAVETELKTLLEHERKILVQLADRASKFSMMKEENKKKIDEWETEHNQRMPSYSQYLKELMEIPEDHCLTQEGLPTTVEQKMLYTIVEKTSHIANNAIVQLSMQNTLINDVDLSLGKLRQFCAVMIKHIDSWLKQVNTQIEHQGRIIELWEGIKQQIKRLQESKGDGDDKSRSAAEMQELEARVSRLENTVDTFQGVDPVRSPKDSKSPVLSKSVPPGAGGTSTQTRRPVECPPCPPPPQPPSPPVTFPTGRDYFGEIYQSPCTPPQAGGATASYPDGRLQRSRATPGQFPVQLIDTPGLGFPIPVAAMEREGRCPGQSMPYSPTSPPLRQLGAFMPTTASSPVGSMRESYEYGRPEMPQVEQFGDPAILPKIQEDLQRLATKNRKLEELVNNFRQMRQLLTDEMDKAVKLNQKLQRDLYYVAQEANKPPQ